MVDENKIRLMIQLNRLENQNGISKSGKYFKSDYVSLHMMRTFISTSIAFFLVMFVVVVVQMEYFLTNMTQSFLNEWAKEIVFIYLVYILVFQIIAFILYTCRYKGESEELYKYRKILARLDSYYKKEELVSEESDEGEDE